MFKSITKIKVYFGPLKIPLRFLDCSNNLLAKQGILVHSLPDKHILPSNASHSESSTTLQGYLQHVDLLAVVYSHIDQRL